MEPTEPQPAAIPAMPFPEDVISRQIDWPSRKEVCALTVPLNTASLSSAALSRPPRKEVCALTVPLTEAEMIAEAHTLTENLSLADQIKSEAKAAADQFKARAEKAQSAINRSRVLIDRGADTRDVECVWVYETAGADESGSLIADPDRRTLVRTDTWEAIRHERIPEEDLQWTMFGDEELSEEGGAE